MILGTGPKNERERKVWYLYMKNKLVAVLLTLLSISMIAGCGKKTEEDSGNDTGAPTVSTQNPASTDDNTGGAETIRLSEVEVEKYMSFSSDYKGLAITVEPKAEVTQEQIDQIALNAYNGSLTAENGITDRVVEMGDLINFDYEGKNEGVAFEGGAAQNQMLEIGSGGLIDGFEDGLVGALPGKTFDLDLTFPDGYGGELGGKDVVFTVTVNYIYPSSSEEMIDEVIATITDGEYTTTAAFLDFCQEYLEESADYNYQVSKETAVISELDAIAVFESTPGELEAKYSANILKSLNNQAAQYGVDADTFCTYYYQMDAASYIEQASQASVRQSMIFQYIANKEDLNVSNEELDESLQKFADENRVESVEVLLADTDKEDFREYFMFEKVIEFVFEHAEVTEN